MSTTWSTVMNHFIALLIRKRKSQVGLQLHIQCNRILQTKNLFLHKILNKKSN